MLYRPRRNAWQQTGGAALPIHAQYATGAHPIMTHPPTSGHQPTADSTEGLTVVEVCQRLKISKATFYHWRQTGQGPHTYRLPNGALRVDLADLTQWKQQLKDAA